MLVLLVCHVRAMSVCKVQICPAGTAALAVRWGARTGGFLCFSATYLQGRKDMVCVHVLLGCCKSNGVAAHCGTSDLFAVPNKYRHMLGVWLPNADMQCRKTLCVMCRLHSYIFYYMEAKFCACVAYNVFALCWR
uniref:Uncharacterized protein n=1 Tax=Dunaliella tertiolecta TaxID=3047 RepID=A0A7S3RA69_DUNTE